LNRIALPFMALLRLKTTSPWLGPASAAEAIDAGTDPTPSATINPSSEIDNV
jgi:hypothetical protein